MSAHDRPSLRILHLYPQHMNMYGDWGNVLALVKRGQWHGYDMQVIGLNPGDEIPTEVDLVVGGGGQDSGQVLVSHDLQRLADQLHTWAEQDTPMLVICGLYQLFGHFFQPVGGERLPGIGIFNAQTVGGSKRMIGNTVVNSTFGELVGFENHSGVTTLGQGQQPLGQVVKGAGNNGKDGTEGAVYRQVYGSYLHGSLLPKNPVLADALLHAAASGKYGALQQWNTLDDAVADQARNVAKSRPR